MVLIGLSQTPTRNAVGLNMEALPSLLHNTLPEVPGVGDIHWEYDQRLQPGLMHQSLLGRDWIILHWFASGLN